MISQPSHRTALRIISSTLCAALLCAVTCDAQTNTNTVAPVSAADLAWKEVESATKPPMPPAEWQTQRPTQEQIEKFRLDQGKLAGEAADKAADFAKRFPDHPKAELARKKNAEMINIAVRLGNTDRMAELEKIEAEKLKDPNLSEDERLQLRMKAVMNSMRGSSKPEYEKNGRELIKEFPKHDEGYRLLLYAAQGSEETKARALISEIKASDASDQIKDAAAGIIRKLESLGKPLDIAFTSVDGRAVDIGKMKGKVVLVDFWATWCGPCVAEIPNVKKTYAKLHDKGFEIVGISFDKDRSALETFVSEKEMPWPQYFDGEGWANKFGRNFGINSIPTMWLVDKKGVLRDLEGRSGLEEKIEKFLAE